VSVKPPPLPEVRWTWRRVFSFAALFLVAGLLGQTIERIHDQASLETIALSLNRTLWVVMFFYLCGPTVTDLARIIAAVRGGAQPEKAP
jgi:hypothetical protein